MALKDIFPFNVLYWFFMVFIANLLQRIGGRNGGASAQVNYACESGYYDDNVDDDDEEKEKKYGFARPDFKSSSICGTVPFHDKHLFVLTRKRSVEWDQDMDRDDFISQLRKCFTGKNVRISYAEATDKESAGDEQNGQYDILVMPDMIKYVNVNASNTQQFADSVYSKGTSTVQRVKLVGSHVFVSCHVNKSDTEKYCGPRVFRAFCEQLPSTGKGVISVRRTTSLGGNNYAANIIIYRPSNKGVSGDWYGYVDLTDVPKLINHHMNSGKVVKNIWRGRCGVTQEFTEKLLKFMKTV